VYNLSNDPLSCWLLALPTNIRLDCIEMPITDTAAYYERS